MRPIDADAMDVENIYCYYSDHCRSEDVQEWVDEQPTLDLEPVRHGRWKERPRVWGMVKECSVYHQTHTVPPGTHHYCPNCGAKMDLEVAE